MAAPRVGSGAALRTRSIDDPGSRREDNLVAGVQADVGQPRDPRAFSAEVAYAPGAHRNRPQRPGAGVAVQVAAIQPRDAHAVIDQSTGDRAPVAARVARDG